MRQTQIESIIRRKFGSTIHYSDGLRVNCPFCSKPDHKHHLYICSKPVKYQGKLGYFAHCFRCGFSSTTQSLLEVESLGDFSLDPVVESKTVFENKSLAEGILPLENAKGFLARQAISYLHKRNIYNFKSLYYGSSGEWLGRIIFPIIEDGEVVFWTGRSFLGNLPKYKNSSGRKGHYIYNLDKAIHEFQVVICEGPFDALSIRGGVALLGKKMTEEQFFKLVSVIPPDRKVIVGLDPDARQESNQLIQRLCSFYENVSYIKMDGKDLAESVHLEVMPVNLPELIRMRLEGIDEQPMQQM